MQNGFLQPQDFDDDDLTSILGLSQNASKQSKLELQARLAAALRDHNPAQGQSVPGGSVFIPPNPLTTAMQTFDHLQGIVSSMQGKKQGDKLDEERQKGLERFARLWFNKNGQGQQQDQSSQDPNAQDVPQQ